MNLFGIHLTQVHAHLLLNHFPITGLFVAWLLLLGATLFKQRAVVGGALWMIILCAGMAFPVMETGEHSGGILWTQLDKRGQHWLHEHGERADKISKACYVLAALALLGFGARVLNPKMDAFVAWLMILLTAGVIVGTVWVADAGGKIRHSELRAAGESDHH